MSIFDPLGFLAPFTIQSRILMQRIWSTGIGWDEIIGDAEFSLWLLWIRDLEKLKTFSIPRCYQLTNFQIRTAELHIFCDASEKAFAAVAYWRFLLKNNLFHTSIIMSKSRVSPLKVMTIPRLELQAAVLSTRVALLIEKEHDFKIFQRIFWSDSETVLKWIKKDPRDFKMYVANRLSEISENTKVSEWRWVGTKENPADDATRLAPNALVKGSRWLQGPPFLREPESRWPVKNLNSSLMTNTTELEVKRTVAFTTCSDSLIDFKRFSLWYRLVSTVARVIEIVDKMRKRVRSPVERRNLAAILLFKQSQIKSFNEEILLLKGSKIISRSSRILNLNPFLDSSNLLRAEGRLKNVKIDHFSSNPIILDAKDELTKLLIKSYHQKFYHGSHESVINEMRQKFWVVGLRQALRGLVNRCVICKLQRSKPCNPKMAALPESRLAIRLQPFSHCGLDYFGPLQIKIGRRREKRYGALFTCMTTRAIHIELANSLNTDSAIMALKRFIARRGKPINIYCDNGTNFKGMDRELKQAQKEIDKSKFIEFTSLRDINFRFNPPSASHMGGAWERLIRSVKTALTVILKNQIPHEETLLTALVEIEHCVNSRLLSHVSVDPRDQEAITPNHFLIGASSGEIRFGRCDAAVLCSRKHWRIAQFYADCFWRRWIREYLPSLVPRKKWEHDDKPLKEGDMVLILDDNLDRNQWRRGVITRDFPASDNQVRVAEVRTNYGIFVRPARKLIRFLDVQNP